MKRLLIIVISIVILASQSYADEKPSVYELFECVDTPTETIFSSACIGENARGFVVGVDRDKNSLFTKLWAGILGNTGGYQELILIDDGNITIGNYNGGDGFTGVTLLRDLGGIRILSGGRTLRGEYLTPSMQSIIRDTNEIYIHLVGQNTVYGNYNTNNIFTVFDGYKLTIDNILNGKYTMRRNGDIAISTYDEYEVELSKYKNGYIKTTFIILILSTIFGIVIAFFLLKLNLILAKLKLANLEKTLAVQSDISSVAGKIKIQEVIRGAVDSDSDSKA